MDSEPLHFTCTLYPEAQVCDDILESSPKGCRLILPRRPSALYRKKGKRLVGSSQTALSVGCWLCGFRNTSISSSSFLREVTQASCRDAEAFRNVSDWPERRSLLWTPLLLEIMFIEYSSGNSHWMFIRENPTVASIRQKLILPFRNISDTLGRGIHLAQFSLLPWCCDLLLTVLSSLLEAFLRYLVTLDFPLQRKRGAQKLIGKL